MAWILGAAAGNGGGTLGTLPELLTRALEWPPDDQAPFFVSIHITSQPQAPRPGGVGAPPTIRRGIAGRPCWSYAEAAQRIGFGVSRQRDVYFCTATCTQWETKTNNERTYQWRQTKRDMGAVGSKKCLYVDVDVKPGGYATYDAARAAFDALVAAIRMPAPSFIVLSGSGGFHAYWTFTEAVKVERWQPMANKLAAALAASGFTGDLGVSVDPVRILRVPGTYNHKTATPAPVQQQGASGPDYDPGQLEQILAPWPEHRAPKAPAAPRSAPPMPDAFKGAGVDPAFARSTAQPGAMSTATDRIEDIAQVCPFLSNALATGGAGYWEPLWKETINVALHVADSRGVAHRLSQGHADYDPAVVDAKFDQQFHVKQTRPGGLGFPQCHTLHRAGAAECPSCPHFKEGKSPFNFVIHRVLRALAPAPASPPGVTVDGASLPEPYVRNSTGLVVWNDDPVCHYAMANPELVEGVEKKWALRLDIAYGRENRRIEVACETMGDKRKLFGTLSNQHMMIDIQNVPKVMRFMTSLVSYLQALSDTNLLAQPFGWHDMGFVTADMCYGAQGRPVRLNIQMDDKDLLAYYQPRGSLAEWQKVARLVTDMRRPDHNAVLAAAFASPLVALSGTTDALWLSAYSSDSGVGKSTTLQVMHTVWGSLEHRMLGTKATPNSVAYRLGVMRHLPVAWDDLRINDDEVRSTVLQIVSGQDKNRLTSQVTERRTGSWRNLLISNSNLSIHDACADSGTAAELLRVFEYRVGALDVAIPASEAERRLALLGSNHGVAGDIYAMWLGAHKEVAARLQRTVRRWFEVQCRSENEQSERFWLRSMAALYSGAVIARHLGLLDFSSNDLMKLRVFLMRQLVVLRGRREESDGDLRSDSALNYVRDFLHAYHRAGTVQFAIDGTPKMADVIPTGAAIIIERRGEEWRFARTAFKEWMKRTHPKGHSAYQILQVLKGLGAREARVTLGVGLASTTPAVRVIVLDGNLPAFQNQL